MRPMFRITADGGDITANVQDRLISMTITDEAGMESDSLELTLDDRGGVIAVPRRGAKLRVSLGYDKSGLADMGSYVVDEVEISRPPEQMRIRGKAADMIESIKAPRTKEWRDTTIEEIVEEIADRHDLRAKVAEELGEMERPYVAQTDESDLHFLTRLGKELDAVVKVAGGTLVFAPYGQAAQTVGGGSLPTVSIAPGDEIDVRVTIAERGKYGSVVARWHEQKKAEQHEEKAGDGDPVLQLPGMYPNKEQAEQAAEARLKAASRGKSQLSMSMPGNVQLAAEARISLTGFREGIDGAWTVTSVTHTLDSSGYRSSLQAESGDAASSSSMGLPS